MEAVKLLAAGIGMGWGPCLALSGPILLPYISATKGGWREGLRESAARCASFLASSFSTLYGSCFSKL